MKPDREATLAALCELSAEDGELDVIYREVLRRQRGHDVAELAKAVATEAKLRADREAKREKDYAQIKEKVEREFPIRQKLAKLTGRRPEEKTIEELFTLVLIHAPDKIDEARKIAKG